VGTEKVTISDWGSIKISNEFKDGDMGSSVIAVLVRRCVGYVA
jgi:hypothetical protein